ncbi:Sulfite reductase [NADPH] flavoprotein alpha-component [Marinomonas aquimarina]|uniref:NADPH--hemoprotein reductase n=1 Tax=Marinomonas aquimarina TaxID=295068 RepID=A0A1A8TDG4_9GAMM|nr:flavodoxin domain-containing protein [Marinomonas aquimarina]SBS29788.1 Sulfite reductase [NADPH] flavoprotein alpha-component [Marinomonas aquimarina]
MSWWFSKLIQQLDRMMYVAAAMTLFFMLYLWSVLDSASANAGHVMVQIPAWPLFTLAGHEVYQLAGGGIAQVQEGALLYLFSVQEVQWLQGLSLVSECVLWSVVVIGLIVMKHRMARRYGVVMALLALQLLLPSVYGFGANQDVNIGRVLCQLTLLVLGSYWETRRYRMGNRQSATLIAYASQTGTAKRLAQQLSKSAQSLVDLRCVSELTAQQLQNYRKVFFVVSTHGNGEAPDTAYRLLKDIQQTPSTALDTHFSVLALGDRTYKTFCAFGYQLSDLLHEKGFQRLLPTQTVDRMDLSAVDTWWGQVCQLLGIAGQPVALEYNEFTVTENSCLNPQQSERLAYRIALYAPHAQYQVGDLLAVQPEIDGVAQEERLYSIASCADEHIELLVRRHIREDGSVGVGSGYLTDLAPNATLKASLREHTNFRLVGDVPLIMIGAGTGLAPFIGFLKQKYAWHSQTENWLLFGERYQEQDNYFAEDLDELKKQGILTRMDCAWSKSDGVYVPSLLQQQAQTLRHWVEQKGAHIYVCGSRVGFGESVLAVLEEILTTQQLHEQLHTDLY